MSRLIVRDFILHIASVRTCDRYAVADFHGFHGLHAHQRLRQAAIELIVPLRVAAETGRNIVHNNLKNAAHRVVGF